MHVRGQRRLELQQLPGARMPEREPMRVKRLTRELNRAQLFWTVGVTSFADECVTAQARLQPDLIALAGDEPDLEQRGILEGFDHSVGADRFFRPRIARMRGLLNA